MKARYNPDISLGTIIQIVILILMGIGGWVAMKVHETQQDNKIQQNADYIQKNFEIDKKQDGEIGTLNSQVSRIDERTRSNVRNN